jgi:hypothetical protein
MEKKDFLFIAAMSLLFGVACWLVFSGCTTLGIADRQAMMQKWQGQDKDVELLADINGWANWYAKGDPTEPGKCVDQAEAKMAILKDLNIPAKRMTCTIEGKGHAFVIATLDRDYILDNGTINDVVWAEEALLSTWGVEGVEAW